jgi:hypothetical protein
MTAAHRSIGRDVTECSAARTDSAPPGHGGGRPADGNRSASSNSGVDEVGSLTVNELAIAAGARRVSPSALLDGPAQARMREDLELVAQLPDPVAALAVGVARLDPATAAVLAGMIERYAAADRRHRPPAP